MLLTDKDIRGILYELFNTKWLLVHCLHGRLRILNLNLVLFNRVRHCPNFVFFVEQSAYHSHRHRGQIKHSLAPVIVYLNSSIKKSALTIVLLTCKMSPLVASLLEHDYA
jgi:hypothetical protein